MTVSRTLLAGLVASLAIPASAPAQVVNATGVARVTLVAGATPSRGGRTEVVRHVNRDPRNMIIVDRNATADDLAAAIALMNALRKQFGDSLTSDLRARPASFRAGAEWQNSPYRQWLIDQLARLRRASEVPLSNLGVVRAVDITLPSPTGTISGAVGR